MRVGNFGGRPGRAITLYLLVKTRLREVMRSLATNEGDGARTRNHRIDNPVGPNVEIPINTGESSPFTIDCTTNAPFCTTLATIVNAWGELSEGVRTLLLAAVAAALGREE